MQQNQGGPVASQWGANPTNALVILSAAKPVIAGEHPAYTLGPRHFHLVQIPIVAQLSLRLGHLQRRFCPEQLHSGSRPANMSCPPGISEPVTAQMWRPSSKNSFKKKSCRRGPHELLQKIPRISNVRSAVHQCVWYGRGGAQQGQGLTCCTNTLRRVPRASPTSSS